MKRMTRGMMTAGALALVASLAAATIADAQPRRGRVRDGLPGPRAEMRGQGMERLDLSDDQKAKLAAIREDTRRQQLLLRGKMADLQAQLRVEFMNDDLDKAKIRALHREIGDMRAEAAAARLEARLEARDVFTPEQREQLQSMRGNRGPCGMAPMGQGRGGFGRHGMGRGQGAGFGPGGRGSGGPDCLPGQGPGRGFGRGLGAELGPDAGDAEPMAGFGWMDEEDPGFDPLDFGWMGEEGMPVPPAPPMPPAGEE